MHPSFATRLNLDLLEQNYERWRKDPDSLDSGWSAFFEGFDLGNLDGKNGAAVAAAVGRNTSRAPSFLARSGDIRGFFAQKLRRPKAFLPARGGRSYGDPRYVAPQMRE